MFDVYWCNGESWLLDIIVRWIIKLGRVLGGGAGVAVAGGVAAGIIGMLTGFTQPAITAVITVSLQQS